MYGPSVNLDGPPVDEGAAAMVAILQDMHLKAGYEGEGWYAAEDTRTGLTRYRWRRLSELREQLGLPPDGSHMVETESARSGDDMAQAKSGEVREVMEPNVTRITRADSGHTCYEVNVRVEDKQVYGGRFSTVEEARAKRDQLLDGRAPVHRGRRKSADKGVHKAGARVVALSGAQGEIRTPVRTETWSGDDRAVFEATDGQRVVTFNGVQVGLSDTPTLMRLYNAALQAEQRMAQAKGNYDAAYAEREEAWAALQAFMEGERERVSKR